ncbi:MAG: F0F1 ATP synthase subunit B [Candidatus Doudnabacteria bacterium]|nr:F0F1 ATP synthase subunit B [Candidatus Doudnabacteria bacterium]
MILLDLLIPIAHAQEAATASSGGIASLGLNVKFFIAQLINFAILLLIFWKWILPNVTKALQARTERIEKSLMDADRIEKEKREFETWQKNEMTKARQEASAIVTSAQTEAGKAKQAILDQTKLDQQKLIDQAKSQIESEKNRSISEAKGELANLITSATEKILRQKLDKNSDQELIKESLSNIK